MKKPYYSKKSLVNTSKNLKSKPTTKQKTSIFTWWVTGWFVAYFVAVATFPLLRPKGSFDGPEYQSYMFLFLQLYCAIFALIFLSKSNLFKN